MDIYAKVTDRIIEQLEKGTIPWERPWAGDGYAVSHVTGKPYSLLNQFLLGNPGEYVTFEQCKKEGGKIKKGAKARFVVFWKMLDAADKDSDGNITTKQIPFLRYSNVFNLADTEGLRTKHFEEVHNDNQPVEAAQRVLDAYIAREGIRLEHSNQGGAYYQPAADRIHLPLMEQFVSAEAYYDTAFHECTHSTGHQKRLDRDGVTGHQQFGSMDYSKEELVAEIGACTIINRLGMETEKTFRNNAAYIQNWLKALKGDKKLIVTAAGKAEKAVAYIFGEAQNS